MLERRSEYGTRPNSFRFDFHRLVGKVHATVCALNTTIFFLKFREHSGTASRRRQMTKVEFAFANFFFFFCLFFRVYRNWALNLMANGTVVVDADVYSHNIRFFKRFSHE